MTEAVHQVLAAAGSDQSVTVAEPLGSTSPETWTFLEPGTRGRRTTFSSWFLRAKTQVEFLKKFLAAWESSCGENALHASASSFNL